MPKNPYGSHDSDAEPHSHSRERRLPALHDVLGDVLEQPLRSPYSPSPYSPQEYPDSRRSTPHAQYEYDQPMRQRGPPLAPLASTSRRSAPDAYGHSHSHSHSSSSARAQPQSPADSQRQRYQQQQEQQHAYHLFNYTPNQGLVHQRSSTQEQDLEPAHPRPRLPPSDPSRKYVCADCGNRFSKHSTLRNHLLTHSGEKPFECTFPGCGRRFSMACNMQRHLRTHTSASAFDGSDRMPSTQPSSRGGSRSSSRDPSSSRGGSPREDMGRYSYHRR